MSGVSAGREAPVSLMPMKSAMVAMPSASLGTLPERIRAQWVARP